ncbi:hypothetical protein JCM1841_006357 [Sporobolomyces salmonicolor]
MAKKDLGGKQPTEMDMLLSPSRGLGTDDGDETDASLRNPQVQERFREHVADKLRRWRTAYPSFALDADRRKRCDEELGIILLDLRKLREGITSIRRIDSFACEVYEASVLLSLFASNYAQLSSSLPHLVLNLHPTFITSSASISTAPAPAPGNSGSANPASLTSSLAALSLSNPSRQLDTAPTRAFYLTLHLLHSHLLPAFTSASSALTAFPSEASPSHPPLSTFLPTLLSLLLVSHLPSPISLQPRPQSTTPQHPSPYIAFLLSLYTFLLRNDYLSLSRLLSPSVLPSPPPPVLAHLTSLGLSSASFNPLQALLHSSVPQLRRARFWPVIEKAYRFPPDQTTWLAGPLLFRFEVEAEEGGRGEELTGPGQGTSGGKKKQRGEALESWEEAGADGQAIWVSATEGRLQREAERRARGGRK